MAVDKFDQLKQALAAQAGDEALQPETIVSRLQQWDASYGVEVQDIERHRLTIRFLKLPGNTRQLAQDIAALCPAVIDQHFGRMDQMVELMQETGEPLDEEVARLIRGVDFSKDGFGMELLQRSLRSTATVALWWD